MEPIKEAFDKVKTDIASLRSEMDLIKVQLNQLRDLLDEILLNQEESSSRTTDYFFPGAPESKGPEDNSRFQYSFEEPEEDYSKNQHLNPSNSSKNNPTDNSEKPTDRQTNPTVPTDNPTDNYPFKPSKAQNIGISTGNQGVPTDRQTNQQTNQQTQKRGIDAETQVFNKDSNSMDNALELLSSLDSIKKEIRLKFKELTEQEFLVFSTIYQYDEEQGFSDYRSLSQRLNLSESSVRDYVGKIIKKGIPVQKEKINNKQIKLSVSQNLKKITSLSAIVQLRDL